MIFKKIIEYCSKAKTLKEIMYYFNYKHRPTFIQNHLKPLLNEGKISLIILNKPHSRNQK